MLQFIAPTRATCLSLDIFDTYKYALEPYRISNEVQRSELGVSYHLRCCSNSKIQEKRIWSSWKYIFTCCCDEVPILNTWLPHMGSHRFLLCVCFNSLGTTNILCVTYICCVLMNRNGDKSNLYDWLTIIWLGKDSGIDNRVMIWLESGLVFWTWLNLPKFKCYLEAFGTKSQRSHCGIPATYSAEISLTHTPGWGDLRSREIVEIIIHRSINHM